MKIGIVGAGNIGIGLGRRLAAAGHDIMVSFARDSARVAAAAVAIGGGARAGSPLEAARHGEVVVVATPWPVTLDTLAPLAEELAGRILWDATNPLKPDMSGLSLGTITSGGEQVSEAVPGARVVKAVPPFAEILQSDSMLVGGRRPGVFVAGNDAVARGVVVELVEAIGAEPVDAGPLSLARYTEPLGMLLVQLAYMSGFGARIGAVLVRDPAPVRASGAQ